MRIFLSGAVFPAYVLIVLISGIFFITNFYVQSSPTVLILRFLILPVVCLWCGIVIIKNEDFIFQLQKRSLRIGHTRIVLVASVLYIFLLFGLKFAKSNSMNYELFDAGLYINKLFRMSNSSLSKMLEISLSEGHFQPISLFFAFAYRLTSSPLLPYGIETLFLASGSIPIFKLSQKVLGPGLGSVALSLAYLLNPLVHFNDILGFHPDHIVLPCLLWAFYFAEGGSFVRSTLSLIVISMASEPWIPLAAAFGVFLILQHRKYWLGAFIFILFTFLFYYILFVFHLQSGDIYLGNVLRQNSSYSILFSNDLVQIFNLLVVPRKLFFMFFLFSPFLFLPLRAWPVMVVALPELAKILLSSEMLHYSVEGHYTLGLIAVFFVAYIYGLRQVAARYGGWTIEKLPILTLVLTLGLSVAHSPLPISFNFWSNWSGGSFNYKNYLSNNRTQSLRQAEHLIGNDVNLKVEITNGAFTPNLAKRIGMVYLFPSPKWKNADFILIDKTKYKGAGADSAQSAYEEDLAKERSKLHTVGFDLLLDDDHIQLWSRKPKAINPE